MMPTLTRRAVTISLTATLALVIGGTGFAPGVRAQDKPRYAMLVRVLGNTAFELARVGAEEAANELGVELIYTGPTENTAEGQVELINSLIAQRVDAIMLTANDETALSPSLKRAAQRGIKIVTWDQDTEPSARSLYIAAATNAQIALAPAKIALDLTGGEGEVGIVSGPASSTTQNDWVNELIRLTKEDDAFKGLSVAEVAYGDERSDKAYNEALGLVSKYPDIKAIVAYSSIALSAAAQMVTDQNLIGKIGVTGLGFPNEMSAYVLSGAVPAFAIWNMSDVGYTTLYATHALIDGEITGAAGDTFEAGKLGEIKVGDASTAVLGQMTVYDKSNVQQAADLIKSLGN